MARKSRKNQEQIQISERIPEIQKERKIKVGGYVRLSSEQYESDSIDTQMLMIRQYVNDHNEFEIEDFYVDEGYSGTNFVRPDFTRMMQDVKSGKIECIIVKDFSRFGRNYIEAGYYLETVLPHLGVRFISINDRFDSNREEDRNGISIPIKNLINSMYATDVSRKITKGVELRNELGSTKYRTTTYGYLLDRENNTLVVDPVASNNVKLIFKWYTMGYSTQQIADRLNLLEIPIPMKYKEQYSPRKSLSKSNKWSSAVICFILRNPTYIGCKVNGKQRTRLTEKIDHEHVPIEDWYVRENSHEAIISKDIFDIVAEKLKKHSDMYHQCCREVAPLWASHKNTFEKKVICKECGRTMLYVKKDNGSARAGFQEAYYTCSNEKDDACRQIVYEDYLKTIVLDQIKNLFRYVCSMKNEISDLRDGRKEKSVLISNEKRIMNLKKKCSDFDGLILNLYKDLAEEVIDEKEYRIINEKYLAEKKSVEEHIKRLNDTIYRMRRWIDAFENLGEKFSEYLNTETDSQTLINEVVEKVYVSKNGEIEIIFNCSDVIERFNGLLEEFDEANSNVFKIVAF